MKPEGRNFDVNALNMMQKVLADAVADSGYAFNRKEESLCAIACFFVLNCAMSGYDPLDVLQEAMENIVRSGPDGMSLHTTIAKRQQ